MIGNRYEPLEPLQAGAPIRARDNQTAQTVVLQAVRPLDERLVGIFHPSLIAIFEIFFEGGARLAACEFVPSKSLRAVMSGQPLNAKRASEIVAEVANGVAELHSRGLTHGSITTDSVLITDKGKAKLNLVTAFDSTEEDDVRLLLELMSELTGRAHPELAAMTSAALLAAQLRVGATLS
jgi:serine/threonine protein kinase